MAWTCPACQRRFGNRNQSHECAPAMSLNEYFSTGPPFERPIFEAVMQRLEPFGPVHVEPVSVGIFLKNDRGFAELRPKVRWVALSFSRVAPIDHARIARRIKGSGAKTYYVVNLRSADDVDDDVASWLAEAYLAAG